MTQRPSLFRQEALDFQRHSREWGQVALLQPLPVKVMTWFIAVTTALIIISLFLGQYSRKETVAGYLTPTSGTSKIFVPHVGTIKEIHVSEGQQVREGHLPLAGVFAITLDLRIERQTRAGVDFDHSDCPFSDESGSIGN